MKFHDIALRFFFLGSSHLDQTSYHVKNQQNKVITPEVSKYINETREAYQIPGLSAAFVTKNGTIEMGAWGKRSEAGDSAKPETLYYIGSCSKAFVAAAMGILIGDFEQGHNTTALPPGVTELNWNTKVKDVLPAEWALQDDWASEKASIKDIMAHVSGLRRHDLSYSPSDTPSEVVSSLRYLQPTYELREKWNYNNHMYVVAAHIISTYTGSYTRFVQERIFDPLNMTSSTFSLSKAVQSGKMTQSWGSMANGRRIPHWMKDSVMDMIAGAGGIISNVVDMAKWVELLLNSGYDTHTNTTIIPKASFDQITSAQAIVTGAPVVGYGAGWARQIFLGRDVIWHNGGLPGTHAQLAFLPSEGIGMIQLLNTENKQPAVLDVQQRVLEQALGLLSVAEKRTEKASSSTATKANTSTTSFSLPFDVHKYSGTYSNPAYGNLTLCAPHTLSTYCEETRSNFSAFALGPEPQLLATWLRFWASHVRITFAKDSGDKLYVEFTTLFPNGYGADESPFQLIMFAGGSRSKFTMDDGEINGFQLDMDDGVGNAWFQKI